MKINLRIPNYFKLFKGEKTFQQILKYYIPEAKTFAVQNPHLGTKKELIKFYINRIKQLYKEGKFK